MRVNLDLDLLFFGPYQADPRPRGVQEEDGVRRFQWPPAGKTAPVVVIASGSGAGPDGPDVARDVPAPWSLEEVPGARSRVERVARVRVRHPGP